MNKQLLERCLDFLRKEVRSTQLSPAKQKEFSILIKDLIFALSEPDITTEKNTEKYSLFCEEDHPD